MGEEEKQPEGKKMEEKKPEELKEEKKEEKETKAEGKNEEEKKPEEPKDLKPREIVLRVFMHCEGCARKVRRCLKGFEGVEDVQTDCRTHRVIVKGEKADPVKVLERVQRKSHRQVELLSPIPKPPADEPKKEEEVSKPEEKKEEPQVITVVLKFHMHCEACAQEIKKRIQRMKGVENAEPDLKSSQVTVKGVFDPQNLVEYVYKRTGKHGVIVKQEPENKGEDEKGKTGNEEKKGEEEVKKVENEEGKKDGGEKAAKLGAPPETAAPASEFAAADVAAAAEGEEMKAVEVKKNEFYYYYPQQHVVYPQQYMVYPPRYAAEIYNPYPPQMFSDENPNACSVM